ncbi:caspase family protein [Streptomyces scopuliridis]|uniref:caspase, EACC1-associated type n=1 Tax=Streptomyces scopuliridis TaxID=452529 RepID=UPI003675DC0E
MRFPDPRRSRAVLIGTYDYERPDHFPNIDTVQRNLQKLKQLLSDPETGVFHPENVEIVNPDSSKGMIKNLRREAGRAEDVLLVYYSGHGAKAEINSDLFLTVSGSSFQDEFNHIDTTTAVAFEDVARAVTHGSRAEVKVVILDCCYSGKAVEGAKGFSLVTSTQTKERARSDGRSFTSEFIKLLSEGIQGSGGAVGLSELYIPLKSAMADTGQRPNFIMQNEGIELGLRRASNLQPIPPGDQRSEQGQSIDQYPEAGATTPSLYASIKEAAARYGRAWGIAQEKTSLEKILKYKPLIPSERMKPMCAVVGAAHGGEYYYLRGQDAATAGYGFEKIAAREGFYDGIAASLNRLNSEDPREVPASTIAARYALSWGIDQDETSLAKVLVRKQIPLSENPVPWEHFRSICEKIKSARAIGFYDVREQGELASLVEGFFSGVGKAIEWRRVRDGVIETPVRDLVRDLEADGWNLASTSENDRVYHHQVKIGRITIRGGLDEPLRPNVRTPADGGTPV